MLLPICLAVPLPVLLSLARLIKVQCCQAAKVGEEVHCRVWGGGFWGFFCVEVLRSSGV